MDGRRRHKSVNTRLLGEFHRLACPINIGIDGTGKACNRGPLDALGNLADRLEIPVGGNRETRFDNIDTHRIQEIGHFELFF